MLTPTDNMLYEYRRKKYLKVGGYICPQGCQEYSIPLKPKISATLALLTTLKVAGKFLLFLSIFFTFKIDRTYFPPD